MKTSYALAMFFLWAILGLFGPFTIPEIAKVPDNHNPRLNPSRPL